MNQWQDKAISKEEALAEAIKAVYENIVEMLTMKRNYINWRLRF